MTLDETLQHPDKDILKSGELIMVIVREWSRLTGKEPDACDCKFKSYLSYVRQDFINRNIMPTKVYHDGQYYDLETITEIEKKRILDTDKRLYFRLYGSLPIEKVPEKVAEPKKIEPKTVSKKTKPRVITASKPK